MKTKTVLIIIITAFSGLGAYSQFPQNTTWKAYYPEGTFIGYFHLGTDTLSVSMDNISYTNISTFQISGNNLSIVDLPGGDCSVTDTGRYTYLIQNDTLKFILVNDLCSSRVTSMTTIYLIRFLTGIQSINVLSVIKLYPNPSSDKIKIVTSSEGHLSILNISGQQLLQQEITEPTTAIDVSNLSSGIYFVKVTGERTVQMGKFIKQ